MTDPNPLKLSQAVLFQELRINEYTITLYNLICQQIKVCLVNLAKEYCWKFSRDLYYKAFMGTGSL